MQSVSMAWLSMFLSCMQISLEVCNLFVFSLSGLLDHLSPGTITQEAVKASNSVFHGTSRKTKALPPGNNPNDKIDMATH